MKFEYVRLLIVMTVGFVLLSLNERNEPVCAAGQLEACFAGYDQKVLCFVELRGCLSSSRQGIPRRLSQSWIDLRGSLDTFGRLLRSYPTVPSILIVEEILPPWAVGRRGLQIGLVLLIGVVRLFAQRSR